MPVSNVEGFSRNRMGYFRETPLVNQSRALSGLGSWHEAVHHHTRGQIPADIHGRTRHVEDSIDAQDESDARGRDPETCENGRKNDDADSGGAW